MTQHLVPDANPVPQDWHSYPGGRSYDQVNEGVDAHDSETTYVYAHSGGDQCLMPLASGSDPLSHYDHVLRVVHARHLDAGIAVITGTTVELLQGSTVIATLELPAPDDAWTEVTYELTEGECAAITDYTDLKLRLTAGSFALSGGAAYAEHRITACQLDLPDVGSVSAGGGLGFVGTAVAVAALAAAGALGLTGTASAQPWSQAAATVSLAGTATASVASTYPAFEPDPSYNWIPFCSVTSGVPDHPVLRCALFRSAGTPPSDGRAAICVPIISNWTRTEQPAEITHDNHPEWHAFLVAGYDLWLVSLPVARGGASPVATSSGSFDVGTATNPQLLGPAYVGNGVSYNPGGATPSGLPTHPVADPEWLMPFKAFAMWCQWLVDGNGAAAGTDMTRLTMKGRSAGAETGLHVVWGLNLAPYMFPAGSGQDAISTRGIFAAAICEIAPVWFRVYKGTSAGTDFKAVKFPVNSSPWNVPANDFDQVLTNILQGDSPLFFGQLAPVAAANAQIPTYFQYAQAGVAGEPYTTANVSKTETVAHSAWNGKAAVTAFPANTRLVATAFPAYDAAYFDEFIDVNALGEDALYEDEIEWLNAVLDYNPHADVAAAGTFGLSGHATPQASGPGWYERLANIVRGLVGTHVEDALGVPVYYDNEPQDAPTAPATHVRSSLQYDGTEQIEFGVRPSFRSRGELLLTIRVPADLGEEPLAQVADAAIAALRFNASVPPVIFRAPSLGAPALVDGYWTATLACPFRADNVQPLATATPGAAGSTTTLEALGDVLRARFGTYIEDALSVPVVYDNEGQDLPTAARWVRLTLRPGGAFASALGSDVETRTPGLLMAQVFVDAGLGEQQAWDLVDAVAEQFSAVADTGIVLRAPSVRVVGRTDALWQVNVACPFFMGTAT